MANAHVIHVLGDNVSTSDIYPDSYMAPPPPNPPPPAQCAFGTNTTLHNKLLLTNSGQSIAILSGDNFGCGSPPRLEAVAALLSYNLTIVAKSISPEFLQYCGNSLRLKLIQCPTLLAAENDVLDITSTQVINATTNLAYPIVPSLKVIYVLGNNITTNDIYPAIFLTDPNPPPPADCAFKNIPALNNALRNKIPGIGIVLVCGTNFGCGTPTQQAVDALKGHLPELNVISKFTPYPFFNKCSQSGFGIVICPTISAAVDDELEIQTFKVINRTRNIVFDRGKMGIFINIYIFISNLFKFLLKILTGNKK
ncbi:MAG: hypothetical protein WCR42_08945 [bacterium]